VKKYVRNRENGGGIIFLFLFLHPLASFLPKQTVERYSIFLILNLEVYATSLFAQLVRAFFVCYKGTELNTSNHVRSNLLRNQIARGKFAGANF
jgi:hypothetical protein